MSVSTPSYQLSEYLEKLPGTTFRKLYQQPSTAFAIFRRMLPHLGMSVLLRAPCRPIYLLICVVPAAKTFVMALLYMPNPLLLSDLDIWVKPEAKQ